MVHTRHLIIGASAAGINAAEAIREYDARSSLIIVSDEPMLPYSRVLATYYLGGYVTEEGMAIRDAGIYNWLGITLLCGRRAVAVNPRRNEVMLDDGTEIAYEKLLIAAGASAQRPDIPGIEGKGAFTLRTLEDARRIAEATRDAHSIVAIGGGLVSLQAINALFREGVRFTVVIRSNRVLSQTLDERGACIIESAMRERGVEVMKGRDAIGVVGENGGQKVALDDGQEIDADAVVVGKGVRPNVGFLAGSGIAVNYGVVVDGAMRTNIDNIYAAGDIAEGDDFLTGQPVTYGIWPVAIDQGRVAGARMAGREEAYEGSLKMNVTKLFGVTAAVVGDVDSGAEDVVYEDRERRIYRRIAFDEDGRVTGAVLVGLVEDVGVLGGVIKRRLRSGEWRKSIARNPLSTAQLLRQCLQV